MDGDGKITQSLATSVSPIVCLPRSALLLARSANQKPNTHTQKVQATVENNQVIPKMTTLGPHCWPMNSVQK